jgi:hypothetical protein
MQSPNERASRPFFHRLWGAACITLRRLVSNRSPLFTGLASYSRNMRRSPIKTARELGVRLRISADFERLAALNKQHRDSWARLIPIFAPAHSNLDAQNAFFIEGIDEEGATVVTSAGRLYDFGDRSLASELRSLHVFFAEPGPRVAAGESVEIRAPAAENICGRTMFSGAVWVRPDYRRHGFTKIVPRLTRSCALTLWNTPVFWMIIEPELDDIGVTRAYGSWDIDGKLITHLPSWRGDVDFFCVRWAKRRSSKTS